MSRSAQTFRQGDITKAVKGAVNAGLSVKRVEIDKAGKIILFTGAGGEPSTSANEWDDVK
jgi:hypothetical protein